MPLPRALKSRHHDFSFLVVDYDSSLLTKGRQNGKCTFIAPLEEGIYHLKLVRNEEEELATSSFQVVDPRKQAPPPSPVGTKRIIQRFDSPNSVLDMAQGVHFPQAPSINIKSLSTAKKVH